MRPKGKVIGKMLGKDIIVTPEFERKLKEIAPEMTLEEVAKKMGEGVVICATCCVPRQDIVSGKAGHKNDCPQNPQNIPN